MPQIRRNPCFPPPPARFRGPTRERLLPGGLPCRRPRGWVPTFSPAKPEDFGFISDRTARFSSPSRCVHRRYTRGTPDAQRIFRCTSGVHPVYLRCTRSGSLSGPEDLPKVYIPAVVPLGVKSLQDNRLRLKSSRMYLRCGSGADMVRIWCGYGATRPEAVADHCQPTSSRSPAPFGKCPRQGRPRGFGEGPGRSPRPEHSVLCLADTLR